MIDLFETPELLPLEIQNLLELFTVQTYETCAELLIKLIPLGYTFDYGLDAVPYNLRKIL